jgi:uncharacterized protein YjbJ (UPF0337 family)
VERDHRDDHDARRHGGVRQAGAAGHSSATEPDVQANWRRLIRLWWRAAKSCSRHRTTGAKTRIDLSQPNRIVPGASSNQFDTGMSAFRRWLRRRLVRCQVGEERHEGEIATRPIALWPGLQSVSGLQRQVAKELNMSTNKDQVKGALKDIGGKIQEEAGKLVGSTKQQVKGLKNQAKGKVQKGVGDLKEAVSDVKKAAKK